MNRIMEKMNELIKTLKEISTQQIDPYLQTDSSATSSQMHNSNERKKAFQSEEKLANLVADIKAQFSNQK